MSDPSLRQVQSWMQDALIHPERSRDTGHMIAGTNRLRAAEALAIYQRSYYSRLLKCLSEQYPALCHALGEQLFTDFAREYLHAYPSESYTLHELGRRFVDYLDETRPDGADAPEIWIDFMIDLAGYERQLFVMFDAPGHEDRRFATLETPDARLVLQPCFAVGAYRFAVGEYYHDVQRGKAPELPDRNPWAAAIVRRDYVVHTYPITGGQAAFLKSLSIERDIAKALDAVAEATSQHLGAVASSWLDPTGIRGRWIEAGFFLDSQASERRQPEVLTI